ncbi:MAG: CHAD domain-containing protein [Leptolyngbyaceae cyanobacterium]
MAAKTVSTFTTHAVKRYLKRAERYEKTVIHDRNPEDLHQMRVNLRKLRTVIQVFAPGICLPQSGREPQIAAISRKLGKLRDLDVIRATLQKQYLPDLPDKERKTLAAILEGLSKRRKKLVKKTKSTLRSDRYQAIKKSLYQWTSHPIHSNIVILNMDVILPDLTLPSMSRLWLHPGWLVRVKQAGNKLKPEEDLSPSEVDGLVADQGKILHSLRKLVKRVRYQLRLISEFYGDCFEDDLVKLTALQEVLGSLQDSRVMEDFLDQVCPDWQTSLPTLKALLAHNRHRAWQQWQELQRYYLEPQNRDSLRQCLIQPESKRTEAS